MRKKIETKDLINVGVFTALYIVTYLIIGMIGYIPILMLIVPALFSLIGGIPIMLFLTKVRKFGMLTLMGILLSIFSILMGGQPWFVALPSCVITAFLGDLIMRAGDYQKWKNICLGYIVFSEWLAGLLLSLFIIRESFFNQLRQGYGDAYVETLLAITPAWMFPVIVALTALGALGGAFLGRAILKKHFLRAGIV
jgi:energy-coupling factor transport system substrate-specific component